MAVEMYRHDGSGARRNRLLDPSRVQIECRILNIHINRFGADVGNSPTSGYERARSGNHFVARFYIEQEQSNVQRGGAAVKSHAVFRPAKPSKILFELR